MAYFLGRDVVVAVTTEDEDAGFTNTSGIAAFAGTAITGDGTNIGDLGDGITQSGNAITAGALKDVTGVDLTLGTVDEDVAYMGQKTALKAQIKNETTVVVTKKRGDGFWNSMWNKGYRWGVDSAGTAFHDGLSQPTYNGGYRLHLVLKGATENMTIYMSTLTDYAISLNADGVQEETLTFTSHVTPTVQATLPEGILSSGL
jgi:hypothetical protein